MSVFCDAELTYLAQGNLGRLATIDAAGMRTSFPSAGATTPGWT
jgi:hypothetical protein